MPDQLAPRIICRPRDVGPRKALAGRAADHAGRPETSSEITVHVREANLADVGDIAAGATWSIAVPRRDRPRPDVIGQANVKSGLLKT
ncbi:MAG: hypothetical protein OXF56_07935, partial [Rhodobacteraceae bacterium]|nr:hypothetical protein [Paracoccaceae bacterium]